MPQKPVGNIATSLAKLHFTLPPKIYPPDYDPAHLQLSPMCPFCQRSILITTLSLIHTHRGFVFPFPDSQGAHHSLPFMDTLASQSLQQTVSPLRDGTSQSSPFSLLLLTAVSVTHSQRGPKGLNEKFQK